VAVTPANGSATSDNTPTYTGTAEASSSVAVLVDGSAAGTTTADGSGNWSLSQPSALGDGSHTVKAHATDAAGNTSVDSNTNTFTVDTTAPTTPEITAPTAAAFTTDQTPVYAGTADVGTTITLRVDGASIGTTTADATGHWSFTQPAALADGSHSVSATATDGVGNVSPASPSVSFTVDTAAPAAPVITDPAANATLAATLPTYAGTAEPNATVFLEVDGATLGSTAADGAGRWSISQLTALSDGAHTLSVAAQDAAGNLSSTTQLAFSVDATAPAAPVVTGPATGVTLATNAPVFTGSAEANSTVTVTLDGAAIGNTTADGAGAWSFSPSTTLNDGAHTVSATAADAVGNTSPASAEVTFTLDTTAPTTQLTQQPAATTSDTSATFAFDADEDGATFTCSLDGAAFTACSSPVTYDALAVGKHTFGVRATDAVGNVETTPVSASWEVQSATTPVIDAGGGGCSSTGSPVDAAWWLAGLALVAGLRSCRRSA
jgi:hypothetical protein